MTVFFFGVTPNVEMPRLRRCTVNAQLTLHVVPISEEERDYAKEKGPEALVDYFETHGIEPIFDLDRKPKL